MWADPLDSLLRHFSVDTDLIHSGPLCGHSAATLSNDTGHVHVIQSGWVDVRHDELPALFIAEPTVLFYPRPLAHRFLTDEERGADVYCATVAFRAGRLNPIVQALPPMLAVPLADAPEMRATLELLLSEAAQNRVGRRANVGRLFEILLTLLIRKIMSDGLMTTGLLAGLGHPQLGKALVALHDAPDNTWTLEKLADVAGMSRSRFASAFKRTLGSTLGDYLGAWRLALAQELLRRDTPLKHVASKVGYGSPLALARAFRARLGISPRAWLKAEEFAAPAGLGS